MKSTFLFVLVLILLVPSTFAQKNSEWRGPDRNGIYAESNLLKEWPEQGPEKIIEVNGLGKGYSSVTFANDKIYTTGTFDSTTFLFILSKEGEVLVKKQLCYDWTKTYPGARCTPTIIEDKGYFISGLAELICFNANDGSVIWSLDLAKEYEAGEIQHGYSEILLVKEDKLFCMPGGKKATMIALNKDTGKEIWKTIVNNEKSAYCSPLIVEKGGKELIISNTDKSTICLDAENGNLVWTHQLRGKHGIHANTPIYKDGYLLVMDGFEAGCDLLKLSDNGSEFEIIWRDTLLDETNGHAVWVGENIYIAAESKKSSALLTGKLEM